MKLADKALFRRVSESPGRNESEPIGGPEKEKLQRAGFADMRIHDIRHTFAPAGTKAGCGPYTSMCVSARSWQSICVIVPVSARKVGYDIASYDPDTRCHRAGCTRR